jgi:hypothetical protein
VIAHVLSGSVLPVGVEWLAAVLLFGGVLAFMIARRPVWRRAATATALVGFIVTTAGFVADSTLPGPAPYGLRIVAPRQRTPPNAVITVCGVRSDGMLLTPTDGSHWLAPFIDGKQRPLINASVFPVQLPLGRHEVRFDLVTASQREFSPPATASQQLIVDTTAPPSAPGHC